MTRALLFVVALTFALPFAANADSMQADSVKADSIKADSVKGDPAAGKTKAYTCDGCHGITGWKNAYPSYHVPRIGGQNYDYLVAALTEYKKGERSHPTMRAQGESLSDQDIRDIAAFVSGIKP